jgi:ubiquitin carboxyl-terminal hydrolase 1
LATREHQDAHELFLVLVSAVSDEAVKIQNEARRMEDEGFAAIAELVPSLSKHVNSGRINPTRKGKEKLREPWEGLIARKRSCITCGWSEGIRCEQLNGLEVAIPMSVSCLRMLGVDGRAIQPLRPVCVTLLHRSISPRRRVKCAHFG